MNEEIKIITLGDIFDNIETEEKAFRFKDYIKDLQEKVEQLVLEIEQLRTELNTKNNIINECSDDILKELKENHHLSYGVALSIRNKLLDYKELKDSD